MTNVLLICSEMSATVSETKKSLTELKNRGYFNLKVIKAVNINKSILEWCDVLYAVRPTESFDQHLFKYARNKGIYVIEIFDDDFLSLGSDYGSEGQGFWWGRKKAVVKILKNTDCLIASNRHIIEKYGKIGSIKDTYVSHTPMRADKFVKPSINEGKVKIVYYVNDGTTGMFDKYIRPALPFIAKEMADRVSFYFLALRPDMSEFDGKLEYHYVPHMTFEKFLLYLKDQKFDIGLAPLDDSEFSKSKYINKFVEYTRSGVAGIYSDCELYRSVIENGLNGILCADSVDSWGMAIKNLADNPEKRFDIANNAQKYAKEHFEEDKVLEKLVAGVPALKNYKAPKHTISNVRLVIIKLYYTMFFRPCGWIYTLYSCTKNGKADVIVSRLKRKVLKRT